MNQPTNSFVEPQLMIGDLIHDGRFFGQHGAVAMSRAQYLTHKNDILTVLSGGARATLGHQLVPVIMVHVNTLNSALGHAVAQAKHGKAQYLIHAVVVYNELYERMQEVLKYEDCISYGEKEVLIPTLLAYARKGKAMQFAEEIIDGWFAQVQGKEVSLKTYLLTAARLHRMGKRADGIQSARLMIRDEKVQRELGPENVARIASFFGMEELAHEMAEKSRPDAKLKYGV